MRNSINSINTNESSSKKQIPVIRHAALIMLLLCLLVTLGLVVRDQTRVNQAHNPAKSDAAMAILFSAIEAMTSETKLLEKKEMGELFESCSKLPTHEGLQIIDDISEQIELLNHRLAQLTAIEGRRNAPLKDHYHLNVHTWAQSLKQDAGNCQYAVQALRTLASPRGANLLANAKWKEQAKSASVASTSSTNMNAVTLPSKSLAQTDPWRGWPGCTWIGGLKADSTAYYVSTNGNSTWGKLLCESENIRPKFAKKVYPSYSKDLAGAAEKDNPSWTVPKDLTAILTELEALRLPEGQLYNDFVSTLSNGTNRKKVGQNEVDVGFNIQLTIDPKTQSLTQQVAECYTGNIKACALVGIDFNKVGAASNSPGAKAMWEKAAARMTAVVVIDVQTGKIEALASAHTPCYVQENDGPFRDGDCPPLWTKPQRRPDALRNHAVFSDNMPGSTVKPIMASVFFEDAYTDEAQLSHWLASSNSDRFNDELFCLNNPREKSCDRPKRVQQRAQDLGWNVDCSSQANMKCAKVDMLFGRHLSTRSDVTTDLQSLAGSLPLQHSILNGQMFVEPLKTERGNTFQLIAIDSVNSDAAKTCKNAGKWHATNCSSSVYKPLVNQSFGQGHARATPLGVASMLARLAAAANGLEFVRRPYLVHEISNAKGQVVNTIATRKLDGSTHSLVQPEPTIVRKEIAQKVFRAMNDGTSSIGTGYLICQHVFGKEKCKELKSKIAGKTGTPTFSFDVKTIDQAGKFCQDKPTLEQCLEKPVKWYVAAYQSSESNSKKDHYDKVIAVMSDRNWYRDSEDVPDLFRGKIHGVNDLNNISTEIAMRALGAGLLNGMTTVQVEKK